MKNIFWFVRINQRVDFCFTRCTAVWWILIVLHFSRGGTHVRHRSPQTTWRRSRAASALVSRRFVPIRTNSFDTENPIRTAPLRIPSNLILKLFPRVTPQPHKCRVTSAINLTGFVARLQTSHLHPVRFFPAQFTRLPPDYFFM
jgi:hypothetical protein